MLSEETFNRILEYGARLHKNESLGFSYSDYQEYFDEMFSNTNPLIINRNTGNELVEYANLYAMQRAYLAFGTLDPDDKSLRVSFKVRNSFYCIFATISNYILSITHLALSGMDLQASTLLRNLYELIMLFLAVSINNDLLDKFLEYPCIDEATDIWYKHFRIGKIEKIVATFEKSHDLSADDFLIEPHASLYKRLSAFVHHQSTALFVFNYGKASGSDGHIMPNMLGYPATRTDDIIDLMCSLLEYTNIMLHIIIKEGKNSLTNSLDIKYEQFGTDIECIFNYFLLLASGFHVDVLLRMQSKIDEK